MTMPPCSPGKDSHRSRISEPRRDGMASGGGNVSTAVLLCGVSSRALALAFRSPQGVVFFHPMTQRRQLALPIFQITFQPIRAWGGTESPALVCKAFLCAHVCWGSENWVLFGTWLLLAVAPCLLTRPECAPLFPPLNAPDRSRATGLDAGQRGEGSVLERWEPLWPVLSQTETAVVGGSHGFCSHRLIPNPPASGEGPSSLCQTGDPTLARPQQNEAGPREYKGRVTSWHETSQPGTGVASAPPIPDPVPVTPRHSVTAAGGAAAGGGMGQQLGTQPARGVAGERKFKQGRAEGTAPLEACAFMSPL